jgi:protein-tyrosine kinase
MSRIHEALKKAEQEKAAGFHGQETESLVDRPETNRTTQPAFPAPNVLPPAARAQVVTETLPDALRFDELWANCVKAQWKPNPTLLVFNNSNSFSVGTEQFRTLRSRLYRIRENQPLQTILISSAIAAEGKTLVATNLAYALVRQQGCRVLLVDADIRSPRIHTLLGAPQTPGIADYLQGGATEPQVVQRGIEEALCFIPSGNHVTHPSELISSKRMKELLERMKPLFDWIIIDSPPALPVADASVLGGLCDGVLFVVKAGSTPSEASQKACQELHDAHIIGVVLNSVEESVGADSYYSYGAYGLAHSLEQSK